MMIQVPTQAAAAERSAEDSTGPAAADLTPDFWQHLAAASATQAAVADTDAPDDPDLAAALDDLATSGDEVVARITLPRVGLPRSGGVAVLRSVAVERISRRQELL
jgi:hypothetical protein